MKKNQNPSFRLVFFDLIFNYLIVLSIILMYMYTSISHKSLCVVNTEIDKNQWIEDMQ